MSGDDQQHAVEIQCLHCGQVGAVLWETDAASERRKLLILSGGFHLEDGRTVTGYSAIICDHCEEGCKPGVHNSAALHPV